MPSSLGGLAVFANPTQGKLIKSFWEKINPLLLLLPLTAAVDCRAPRPDGRSVDIAVLYLLEAGKRSVVAV
jgi:hypothetical protein